MSQVLDSTQVFRIQTKERSRDNRLKSTRHYCPVCQEPVRFWEETSSFHGAEAHAFCVGDEGLLATCDRCFMITSQCDC